MSFNKRIPIKVKVIIKAPYEVNISEIEDIVYCRFMVSETEDCNISKLKTNICAAYKRIKKSQDDELNVEAIFNKEFFELDERIKVGEVIEKNDAIYVVLNKYDGVRNFRTYQISQQASQPKRSQSPDQVQNRPVKAVKHDVVKKVKNKKESNKMSKLYDISISNSSTHVPPDTIPVNFTSKDELSVSQPVILQNTNQNNSNIEKNMDLNFNKLPIGSKKVNKKDAIKSKLQYDNNEEVSKSPIILPVQTTTKNEQTSQVANMQNNYIRKDISKEGTEITNKALDKPRRGRSPKNITPKIQPKKLQDEPKKLNELKSESAIVPTVNITAEKQIASEIDQSKQTSLNEEQNRILPNKQKSSVKEITGITNKKNKNIEVENHNESGSESSSKSESENESGSSSESESESVIEGGVSSENEGGSSTKSSLKQNQVHVKQNGKLPSINGVGDKPVKSNNSASINKSMHQGNNSSNHIQTRSQPVDSSAHNDSDKIISESESILPQRLLPYSTINKDSSKQLNQSASILSKPSHIPISYQSVELVDSTVKSQSSTLRLPFNTKSDSTENITLLNNKVLNQNEDKEINNSIKASKGLKAPVKGTVNRQPIPYNEEPIEENFNLQAEFLCESESSSESSSEGEQSDGSKNSKRSREEPGVKASNNFAIQSSLYPPRARTQATATMTEIFENLKKNNFNFSTDYKEPTNVETSMKPNTEIDFATPSHSEESEEELESDSSSDFSEDEKPVVKKAKKKRSILSDLL